MNTPTPWEIGHQLGDGFSIVHEIAPNCGKLLCLATVHNTGGWPVHGFPLNDEIAKANRDFIIRACNSYAELLAALRDLVESASHDLEQTGYPHDQAMLTLAHIDAANEAITKATAS
jgi:hypothetical protein